MNQKRNIEDHEIEGVDLKIVENALHKKLLVASPYRKTFMKIKFNRVKLTSKDRLGHFLRWANQFIDDKKGVLGWLSEKIHKLEMRIS